MNLSEHVRIIKRSGRHLFSMAGPHTFSIILGSILQSLLPYVPVYFSARLIDALYDREPAEVLALYAGLTVGIVFLLSLASSCISSMRSAASNTMWRNEDWKYSEKAMEMACSSVEDPEVSLLRARIAKESQTGYNLWYLVNCTEKTISALTSIVASLSLTASFFFMESIPPSMKLLFAGGILLIILCESVTTGKSEKLTEEYYAKAVKMNILWAKLKDYMSHYGSGKDIRLYDMSDGLLKFGMEQKQANHALLKSTKLKSAFIRLINTAGHHALRFGLYMMLIRAALSGELTVGSIARYVSCVMLLLTAVSDLTSAMRKTVVNNGYLKRYFAYFDIPNPMYKGSLTVEKRDDNDYSVEFKNVSFRYPGTEVCALRNVNLKFKIGEKLAIVGPNGSGKTTFIKLLCRLYDPDEGEILLNSVDIRKYDYDEYISVFSVVFQDFRLFSFSLGQNVAAAPVYDARRAEQCLRQAGFGERLDSLPEGLKSCLYRDFDQNGIEISGGEAQKIALARALYKDAPFLILDEPTAALDPVSEYEIYSRFNEVAGDKTAVYISHRLASCRFCDKIAVFDGGGIVQTGSHEALIGEEAGKYYELWHAQAQYYTENR